MADLLSELQQRLDALEMQYQLHFAGQPRLTRNPELIEAMAAGAGEVRTRLGELPPSEAAAAALELASSRAALYRSEQRAIAEERRAAGDKGIAAAELAQRVRHIAHRYGRHFAGRSRSTRDLGLLAELIRDLVAVRGELRALAAGWHAPALTQELATVEAALEVYRGEEVAIAAARAEHTPSQREDLLAALANAQFELYRLHFAGQPRVSRRPELLARMLTEIEQLAVGMQVLAAGGSHGPHGAANLRVVRERVAAWTAELEAVRAARAATPLMEMIGALGAAADVVMGLYNERFAGQSRADRDLDLLGALCDRLWDLACQMEALRRVHTIPANERNLEMAYDLLRMLEHEHDAVRAAQQPAS